MMPSIIAATPVRPCLATARSTIRPMAPAVNCNSTSSIAKRLVLDQGVLGLNQDDYQIVAIQFAQSRDHRRTTDKFRDESKPQQVPGSTRLMMFSSLSSGFRIVLFQVAAKAQPRLPIRRLMI